MARPIASRLWLLYWRPALAVVGFLLVHVVFGLYLHEHFPNQSVVSVGLLGFAQLVFSLAVALAIIWPQAAALWREAKLLYDHGAIVGRGVGGRGRVKSSVLTFLRPRLDQHLRSVERLFENGLEISDGELGELIAATFRSCRGAYIGTDKNVPSAFKLLYPLYLDRQIQGRQAGDYTLDTRFLIQTPQALIEDYHADPHAFRAFYDFHRERGIELLQVDPDRAEKAREFAHLETSEIGVYGSDYAIFFKSVAQHRFRITFQRLEVPKSSEVRTSANSMIKLFLTDLNAYARSIRLGNGGVLTFSNRQPDEIASQLERMSLDRLTTHNVH